MEPHTSQVAHIFTDDMEVVDMVDSVIPVACVAIFEDGVNSVLNGIVRGCGRQAMGATLNLIGW